MSKEEATDCLVLRIEEYSIDDDRLDTTIYVIYDKKEHNFVIRGKRNDEFITSATFSFICEFAHELIDFISFVICKKNKWSFVLYNYDNLPGTSNEITYELIKTQESASYELAGYERQEYKRKQVLKYLRMLRNVFNNYK